MMLLLPLAFVRRGTSLVNLFTNGTFDTDTDWTKAATWSISGGTANHSPTGAGALIQSLGGVPSVEVTITISGMTAGNLQYRYGANVNQALFSTNGTHTATVPDQGDGQFRFYASSTFDGSIDNAIAYTA